MSEYSDFISVTGNKNTLGPQIVVGCHRMSENSGVRLHKFHCIRIKILPESLMIIRSGALNRLVFVILQSNLFYVTFQGKIEIWSHKTGSHLTQV